MVGDDDIEEYVFENKIYNIYEHQYNLAVCQIMAGEIEEALGTLKQLDDYMYDEDENKKNLGRFIIMVEEEIKYRA